MQRRRPARDLQARRDRRGGLHQRPAEHHDAGVAPRVAGQVAHRRREHAVGVGEARLQAQDERGVEDVLARRAEVHEGRGARVRASDLLGERLDQRNRQRAGALAFAGQRLGGQAQIRAGRGDDPRGLRRDDAGVGLGVGERALEVEHRPHERLGGQRLGERVAREAPADEVHGDRRSRARTR